MQLYCGLANPESTEASHMEPGTGESVSEASQGGHHGRSPLQASQARVGSWKKGRDIPKDALGLVPTLAPRHIVSRLSPPAIKSFNYCDR